MKKIAKNKKLIYLIIILVVAIVTAVTKSSDMIPDNETSTNSASVTDTVSSFEVHYIDVGQGDSSLIICDGKAMLIDAGENGNEDKVLSYLRLHNVDKLDYIIATHQHTDHIGGLSEVLEEIAADNLIMPRLTKAQTPTNSTYRVFLEAIKSSGVNTIASKVGDVYKLGNAAFEILGPVTDDAESLNSMSVVVKITYGANSFLFTGDAETDEEKEITDTGANLDCDVLKVSHHGSSTSSGDAFLTAASPEICVIMCGKDNDYGHPHKKIINRLLKYTDEIYRTDICGDIVITSDGNDLNVKYENQ